MNVSTDIISSALENVMGALRGKNDQQSDLSYEQETKPRKFVFLVEFSQKLQYERDGKAVV